jgi:hypothetical protein
LKLPALVCPFVVLLTCTAASAAPILLDTTFNADFTASQSLWGGGPNAGLDEGGRTGGSVGLYYSVKADTGTVNATQNAGLKATYVTETTAGSPTTIGLDFLGDASGGFVEGRFGANAQAGVFLDISGCVGFIAFGACVGVPYDIDEDIAIIDEGFFLNPTTTHTPVIDQQRSATEADQAAGVGGLDVVIGTLGPTMNLDLEQSIFFTPTGLSGLASYENQTTGVTGSTGFTIPTDGVFNLDLNLGAGVWDISFQNIALLNQFRNDIDLELRPAFDYIVGSWPPPGQELFSFGLIDDTFALAFNQIGNLGSIQVTVLSAGVPGQVPEPASMLLMGLGVAGVAAWRRAGRGRRPASAGVLR